jgi:glycosyltransferase involved in cell wall biosynthesis
MDALAAFRNAPPQLLEREAHLMKVADVVFTGGPSLYRAKEGQHHNLHCFSSSVDTAHFASARQTEDAKDQQQISHPRLGFYGVIDERMDLELLAAVAEARPDWQIVMVGPVVKISPRSLPRRENIHYLGQRTYAELPSYLAGWDVCLLPFALNESTQYISPTKTLEYMAAGLPIVSTPITDVVEPYGHIVEIATGAAEFVSACERALAISGREFEQMNEAYNKVLSQTSWDRTAQSMADLIDDVIAGKESGIDQCKAASILA